MVADAPLQHGALGRRLFTFAVVADTHVNESEHESTSPFLTNRLANGRARRVFRDIAGMAPAAAFGVHLGDMVHPLPSLPSFAEAVARYHGLARLAGIPFHAVPGNHDVGDKNVSWMPADKVCDAYLALYREAFGRDYYAFTHDGVRFVVINALLCNSGMADEARQRTWLAAEIEGAAGGRVFAFLHYPPYICEPDERSHYDNIDEPAREWLLALLRKPQVEGVFAGHAHNFWYDRLGEAEFYTLPSTAFVRHDFSEFARVPPGDEFGRNDTGKFGWFRVDVHERGHVAYLVRTYGECDAESPVAQDDRRPLLVHTKTSGLDHVGVELRHPWAERMQITATGGVQEFGRKWARNDYPVLALLEMGARLSKVPEVDLADATAARRMQVLARLGHRFIVTSLGVPKVARAAIEPAAAGVTAFEVNATSESLERWAEALAESRRRTGARVYFARLRSDAHDNYDGKQFSHAVRSGATVEELSGLATLARAARERGAIDGVTVRVEPDESLIAAAQRMAKFAEDTGCAVLASLKLEGPNLARARNEDSANVLRVAQATLLSKLSDRIDYVFDTFMDVDRGYFPRTAFIDRRFDPRAPAKAFATLAALTGGAEFAVAEHVDEDRLVVRLGERRLALFAGAVDEVSRSLAAIPGRSALFDLAGQRQLDVATYTAECVRAAQDPVDARAVVLVLLT